MLCMLEFYLDDSGTHDGSTAVVWGGVVGYQNYLEQLDEAWREQLKKPCDGKPPIKAFHSYDLARGIREFEGYNQGERDLTRRNFRKIIIDSGVTILSYGVSVVDWNQVVRLLAGQDITAEQIAFGQAVKAGLEAAESEGQPITFQFDKDADTSELRGTIMPTIETIGSGGQFVSYGFLPVKDVPSLQAADLVVHESYQVLRDFLATNKVTPGPHTVRLFADAHDSRAAFLGRRQIKEAVKKIRRKGRRKK